MNLMGRCAGTGEKANEPTESVSASLLYWLSKSAAVTYKSAAGVPSGIDYGAADSAGRRQDCGDVLRLVGSRDSKGAWWSRGYSRSGSRRGMLSIPVGDVGQAEIAVGIGTAEVVVCAVGRRRSVDGRVLRGPDCR